MHPNRRGDTRRPDGGRQEGNGPRNRRPPDDGVDPGSPGSRTHGDHHRAGDQHRPEPRGEGAPPRGGVDGGGGGRSPQEPEPARDGGDGRRTILALLGVVLVGVVGFDLLTGNDEPPLDAGEEVQTNVQASASVSADRSVVETVWTANKNADHLEVEVDCGDDGSVEGTGRLDEIGETYSHDCSGHDEARVTVIGIGGDEPTILRDEVVTL